MAGGQFTAGVIPPLAGAYFDFEAAAQSTQIINPNGIVALPLKHSFGPANTIVALDQLSDFTTYFGPDTTTSGYAAVRQAFDGEGLPGRGGASQVLAYRMVGSTGAAASLALNNSAATPAPSLTLTSKYKGSWANTNIQIAVVANATNPSTATDVQVWVAGALLETWTLTSDIVAGAAAITAGSSWVTAAETATGTKLATLSATYLAAGADGASYSGSDITAMCAAFAAQVFTVFAMDDIAGISGVTPASVLASLVAWGGQGAGGLNATGSRCMFVIGGAAGEAAVTAASRSASVNDPNFVNVGVGTYSDSLLGTLSTSKLAPRLAGIIAARGGGKGLTFARLARLSVVSGPAYADILSGISNGFMTIGQDSNSQAPCRFEKGVTTWTTASTTFPVKVFGNPKFVLTIQMIERDLAIWAAEEVVGNMPVIKATVDFIVSHTAQYLQSLQNRNLIQPGFSVERATNPPPSDTDDFIAITYGVVFGRDVEKVLNTVLVQ